MRYLAVLLGCWSFGCSGAAPPSYVVEGTRRVEERVLPVDPGVEALPSGTPAVEWVVSQEAGECVGSDGRVNQTRNCPGRSGILVSEGRAVRDGLYRVRYRELRVLYESDRGVWGAQRELYEGQLRRAEGRIREMQPTWLQQNGFALGVCGGLVLGVVSVVAVYGVLGGGR